MENEIEITVETLLIGPLSVPADTSLERLYHHFAGGGGSVNQRLWAVNGHGPNESRPLTPNARVVVTMPRCVLYKNDKFDAATGMSGDWPSSVPMMNIYAVLPTPTKTKVPDGITMRDLFQRVKGADADPHDYMIALNFKKRVYASAPLRDGDWVGFYECGHSTIWAN